MFLLGIGILALLNHQLDIILRLAENGNLDGAKAPGLNDRKCPLYF